MQDLIKLVENFGSPKVALVGDFMLDSYVYGYAERISPESPVPVLNIVNSETRTGGAGNVAEAILGLGAKAICIGVIGPDSTGDELTKKISSRGADISSLIRVEGRSTTLKTRYVGLAQHRHAQQMLRVDNEQNDTFDKKIYATLRAAVRSQLKGCKVLALEDYDKGIFNENYTPQIIEDARQAGVPVIVDPACISDYRRYRGATLLTPNRYETELASGIKIVDDESLTRAANQILLLAEADAVVVTLDKEGAFLLTRDGDGKGMHISTRPRSVYDVTGAGDMVLGMLAVAIAQGCGYEDAVRLANIAGGLEIERFGVVAITKSEIIDELHHMIGLRNGKVLARKKLADELKKRRDRGERIIFTNGCFDLLHMGHVRYLQQARQLGSCLVVAINSDDSIKHLKGPGRPIISQDERADMLGSLECVDYVTIFDEDTPIPLLEMLKPQVLVKGGTTDVIVGQDLVESYGGEVLGLEKVEGLSTTEIINRIVENHNS